MPPSHSLAAADTKTRGGRAAHLLDICAQSLRAQACGQSCNAKRVESSLLRQALPPIHCCSESRFFQGPESAWPVQNTSAHSRGSARVTAADASRCVRQGQPAATPVMPTRRPWYKTSSRQKQNTRIVNRTGKLIYIKTTT